MSGPAFPGAEDGRAVETPATMDGEGAGLAHHDPTTRPAARPSNDRNCLALLAGITAWLAVAAAAGVMQLLADRLGLRRNEPPSDEDLGL